MSEDWKDDPCERIYAKGTREGCSVRYVGAKFVLDCTYSAVIEISKPKQEAEERLGRPITLGECTTLFGDPLSHSVNAYALPSVLLYRPIDLGDMTPEELMESLREAVVKPQ